MSRAGALSYCGGCSLCCRLPRREKKPHKIKYGSAAAAREVCWWGGISSGSFLRAGSHRQLIRCGFSRGWRVDCRLEIRGIV